MKNDPLKDAAKKQEGKRQLKVYSNYFGRSYSGVLFPEIRLCGKWLLDEGFKCGQTITIKHEKNKITIETKANN